MRNAIRTPLTKCRRSAVILLAFSIQTVVPAAAADLGSDCCADLEERIAELEQTTARKGNRAVTLTVSGQINQALLAWDDGDETDVYQLSNANSSDRLRFTGSASVSNDVTAGFYLELGLGLGTTARADQNDANARDNDVGVRQSLWFVDSKSLGAVSVGLGSPATDDIINYNLGGTSVAASANTALVGSNLYTRDAADGGLNSVAAGDTISLRWRRFVDRLDTRTANMMRYDSPIWMGFSGSASWGGDDYWDIAVRYARQSRDFKFAIGVGYYEDQNERADTLGWPRGGDSEPNGRDTEIQEFKGSASLYHIPSGLFVSGAYVHREFSGEDLGVLNSACLASSDAADIRGQGIACGNRPSMDYYWISGGIRQKLLPLGVTSFYVEYARSEDAVSGLNVSVRSAAGDDIDFVTSSSMDIWGAGVVQHVRAAEMDVYFAYRHFQADVTGLEAGGAIVAAPIDDADLFMVGSRIRF